jgi:hypothetical protein
VVVGVVKVELGLELVANIVVSFVRGEDIFAVFQVEIIVVLAALAKTAGKAKRQDGKTRVRLMTMMKRSLGMESFLWVGIACG